MIVGVRMNEREKIIWQTVPIVAFLFCLLVIISNIIIFPTNDIKPHDLLSPGGVNAINAITALVFLYLVFFFDKFYVYTILCVIHGSLNIIEGGNIIGLMLFGLGSAFSFRHGHFRKNPKLAGLLIIGPLVISMMLQLRYGIQQFLHSMLYIFIMILMYALLFILFQPYLGELLPTGTKKRQIELRNFGLKARDCDFIRRILEDEKYENISKQYNISVSAVKQRMGAIYRKLGVTDRNDFIRQFSQAEIIYPEFNAAKNGNDE